MRDDDLEALFQALTHLPPEIQPPVQPPQTQTAP
jgi:hypothetical protein